MKTYLLLTIPTFLFLACDTPSQPDVPKEFFPLNVGNKWIYEVAFADTLGNLQTASIETTMITSVRTQGSEQFYLYPFLIGDPYAWVNRSDGVYINDPRDGPVFHLVFKNPTTTRDHWNFAPYHWAQGVWSVLSTDSVLTIASAQYECVVYALSAASDSLTIYIEFIAPEIGIVQSEQYSPFENRITHKKSLISYQLSPK